MVDWHRAVAMPDFVSEIWEVSQGWHSGPPWRPDGKGCVAAPTLRTHSTNPFTPMLWVTYCPQRFHSSKSSLMACFSDRQQMTSKHSFLLSVAPWLWRVAFVLKFSNVIVRAAFCPCSLVASGHRPALSSVPRSIGVQLDVGFYRVPGRCVGIITVLDGWVLWVTRRLHEPTDGLMTESNVNLIWKLSTRLTLPHVMADSNCQCCVVVKTSCNKTETEA